MEIKIERGFPEALHRRLPNWKPPDAVAVVRLNVIKAPRDLPD